MAYGANNMKMNYVTFGTNDFSASVNFYDSLFEGTGFTQVFSTDRMYFWQCDDFTFAVAKPFDEKEATNGNGTMLGFNLQSEEEVTRLYNKVIELGGSCEGKPNHRGPRFSAYVRDLDKNKICFYA